MGVKLGQKWAVKDGNLLASNQVGSRFFNKEFDFSRASNGTYVDRDGLLKTAELYNKIEYSQDFQSGTYGASNLTRESSSVISPDGFENAYKLIPTAVNGVHILSNLTINNAVYSVFAKQGGYKRFRFNTGSSSEGYASFDLDLGQVVQSGGTYYINSGIEDYGNGWYRCYLAIGATSGTTTTLAIEDNSGSVTFIGDDVSGIYLYGMQAVEGTEPLDYQYTNGLQGLPRISFEDGVGHLLLEPQRSNLLLQSNQFDTSWAALSTGSVVSGQSGIYGSNDAWELTATSSGGNIFQSNSNSGTQTFSVYAKSDGSTGIRLYAFGSVNANAYFNLNTGVVLGASNTLASSIENVGNGWFRCSISFNQTNTGLRFYTSNNSTSLAAGTVYIQHAQLESGSYPTSIIETTTTSVTRLADVCNNSGSAQDFNSEEGVLYAEIARGGDANDDYELISIMDASSGQTLRIGFGKADNSTDWYIRLINGSLNLNVTGYEFEEGFQKIAIKYKSGDSAVWLNGVEIATDTTAFTPPSSFSELKFEWANNFPFYGKVRNVQVFTEALSDEELQKLTT